MLTWVLVGWVVLALVAACAMSVVGRAAKAGDDLLEREALTRRARITRRASHRRQRERRTDDALTLAFWRGPERRRRERRTAERRADPDWIDAVLAEAAPAPRRVSWPDA